MNYVFCLSLYNLWVNKERCKCVCLLGATFFYHWFVCCEWASEAFVLFAILLWDERRFNKFFYLDGNLMRRIELPKGERNKRIGGWCWSFSFLNCYVFVFCLLQVYGVGELDGVVLVYFISWRLSSQWHVYLPMMVKLGGRHCCGNSVRK